MSRVPVEKGSERGGNKSPAYPIASVDNALTLLLSFQSSDSIRVTDASRLLGVAQSTASRMLAMLEYRGLVVKDRGSGAYVPGPNLLALGLSVVRRMDMWQQARPLVEELKNRVDETVHVGILHGREVVFLGGVESSQVVRIGLRVGLALPAHATSAGKVLLAELPVEELRARYGPELPQATPDTIASRDELEAHLAQIRDRGYVISHAENESGLSALGVPVRNGAGEAVAALVVTAPTARAQNESWERRVRVEAIEVAARLGKRLGAESTVAWSSSRSEPR